MPRGKPFVCWLNSPGHYRDVALHIGDIVDLELDDGGIFRGKIGCKRKGGIFPYIVRCGKTEHQAALIHKLKPVLRT